MFAKWQLRSGLISLMALGVIALGVSKASSATAKDLDAIEAVMRKLVAVVNDPAFAKAPRERRTEMLKAFYRPDANLKADEQSLYFGPLSQPVAVGSEKHLANTSLNFEWIFRKGARYALQIDNLQIMADQNLAVAVATTTWTITSPEGRTISTNKGRSTEVFENVGGRWLISHEHLSAIDAENKAIWSEDKLEQELKRTR